MTIRLLRQFEAYPANSIVTLDRATEAGLVSQVAATYTLTGGTVFSPNVEFSPNRTPVRGTSAEEWGMSPNATGTNNAAALQSAISQGGIVTLNTPGVYELASDVFTYPVNTTFAIGPGVSFSISGVAAFPTTLGAIVQRVSPAAAPKNTPQAAKIATIGSSITEAMYTSTSLYGVTRRLNRSYIDFASYALRERAGEVAYNFSLGGSSVSQVLAQIALAAQTDANWIVGDVGIINDIIGGVAMNTIIARVYACIDAIAASGKAGLLINSMPLATGHPNSSAATAAEQTAINSAMQAYGAQRGVIIVDAWSIFVDPTTAAGVAKVNFLQADNIHPSNVGCRALGAAIATIWSPYLTSVPVLPASIASIYDATNSPGELVDNPLMQGTSGTNNTGGTIVGNVPTGLTLSKAGTWGAGLGTTTISARGDGYGNNYIVAFTAAGAASDRLFIGLVPNQATRVSPGDRVYGVAQIDITGMNNVNEYWFYLGTTISGTGGFVGLMERSNENPAQTEDSSADLTGGMWKTPTFTVPASGLTSLSLVLAIRVSSATAAGTFTISRVAIRKV